MSHKATNWAIQQRGLDPATKLLLWQLSDRHNRDTGRCDPSQDRLAHDCEMSRASVNRHLKKLEEVGLIRRVQRLNPITKRQANTSYQLALDGAFSVSQYDTRTVSQSKKNPCLNSDESRVSDCNTNLGREPVNKPVCAADAAPNSSADFIDFWKVHPKPSNRVETEKLFCRAIATGVDATLLVEAAKAYRLQQRGNNLQYIKSSPNWLKEQRWRDHEPKSKPTEAEVLSAAQRTAKCIIDGKPWVANTVSTNQAKELIGQGLVTVKQCKAAGVAT